MPQSPLPAVQVPLPLQAPTCVYVDVEAPSVHVAAPHVVDEVGYVQLVSVTPSHVGPQLVPTPVPLHADRVPWGSPITAEQVPTWPPTSHAWHWPLHAESQHTPSTQ